MFNTRRKFLAYLIGILFNLFLTYCSYRLGEKQFYLIPIIGLLFYNLEYMLLMPITGLFLKSSNYKLSGVDVTNLKRSLSTFYYFELGAQLYIFTKMYLDYKVLQPVMFLITFEAITLLVFMFYWTIKFFWEAKKQNINLKNVSLISLYREVLAHVASIGLPKEDSSS